MRNKIKQDVDPNAQLLPFPLTGIDLQSWRHLPLHFMDRETKASDDKELSGVASMDLRPLDLESRTSVCREAVPHNSDDLGL